MTDQPHGLARGLTNYGDADFSLYLRHEALFVARGLWSRTGKDS